MALAFFGQEQERGLANILGILPLPHDAETDSQHHLTMPPEITVNARSLLDTGTQLAVACAWSPCPG
jgi:hypothetical protein